MKTSWRRLEDVFGLRLQKTFWRRLGQDQYIRLGYMTNWQYSGRTSNVQWRFFAEILNFLGPLKIVLWEISQNSQENICVGTFFLIRLNSVDLQLHWKRKLGQVFSCEFCKIHKNTFFAEHHQTTASDKQYQLLTIFAEKAPSRMFDWVENRLQAKGLKYWAHACFQSSNQAE